MNTIVVELTEMELEMILNSLAYSNSNDDTLDRDYKYRVQDLIQELNKF